MSDDERTPPSDLAAERAVLGSMMLSKRALEDVADIITDATAFYRPAHGTIYEAIVRLHDAGEPVDGVSVSTELTRTGDAQRVGGAPYLHTLISEVLTPANAAFHARTVNDKGVQRHLVNVGIRITQLGYSAEGFANVDELVEAARAEVDSTSSSTADVFMVGDRIDASLDMLTQKPDASPTPWRDLNDLILGWRPGGLYIVGARPGVGKSIAAVQAAISMSQNGHVAFSSLEMSEPDLHFRMVASMAGVTMSKLLRRELDEEDWHKIARQRQNLGALQVSIDDRSSVTVTDIRSHARSVSRRGKLSGVIVDYMQLMAVPHSQSRRPRHEQVADFSRSLKLLAKELSVPVVALAQLNRASEARADKRPTLVDLKESGGIEQDADVVLLLHEDENDETNLEMLVAKNRHGRRGSVHLVKRGWYSRLDTPGESLEETA